MRYRVTRVMKNILVLRTAKFDLTAARATASTDVVNFKVRSADLNAPRRISVLMSWKIRLSSSRTAVAQILCTVI